MCWLMEIEICQDGIHREDANRPWGSTPQTSPLNTHTHTHTHTLNYSVDTMPKFTATCIQATHSILFRKVRVHCRCYEGISESKGTNNVASSVIDTLRSSVRCTAQSIVRKHQTKFVAEEVMCPPPRLVMEVFKKDNSLALVKNRTTIPTPSKHAI